MPGASPRGTYVAIADTLRGDVQSDAPPEFPSEAELMRRFGVARTTVRRALLALQTEGLIESVPGMGWRIRSDGPAAVPLYQQIVRDLTGDIAAGRLALGAKAPSEASLCKSYRVSRPTARRALAELESVGVLEAVHGSGRFVRAVPDTHPTHEPEARR